MIERYRTFEHFMALLRSPLLLIIRLYWGWQFMQTGLGKLRHLPQTTEFFTSLHLPLPHLTAIMCSSLELAGGILLILGLGSRLIALLLTCNMLVAYVTADREALLSILSDPGKFYAADPFTFLFASVLILIFGAGALSLDYLLAGKREIRD